MNTRVVFSVLRLAAICGGLGACGITQGKLHVDTPIMQYQKPDISEITGIDEDEVPENPGTSGGSAQPGK
jgi:hypothetical protein